MTTSTRSAGGIGTFTVLGERFELSRGGAGHNVRPMEGLRGLAVFLVFLVHYVSLSVPWVPTGTKLARFAGVLHAMGNVGVDLFFVLSGYLIYGALIGRPQRYGAFIRRRAIRIYPAFLAVFAIYVVLSLLMPSERKIPQDAGAATIYLLANLLLLPGLFPIQPMITVAWSLSYEFFYYLLIPVLIAAFDMRERGRRWRVAFFVALTALCLLAFAMVGGPVRLAMFLPGILLHESLQRRPLANGLATGGAVALVLALVVATVPAPGSVAQATKVALLGIAFFMLCRAGFSEPGAWLARGLSWTPLRWLGNMSYSYYLIHGLALKALFLVLGMWCDATAAPAGIFWWLLPLAFVVTCVPSAALFLAIERPFSLAPGPANLRVVPRVST